MYVGTSIYKVGMSSVPDLSRLRSYGKGSRYIGMAEVGSNYLAVEKTLIREFNESFRLARGREYFDVDDEAKARSIFLKTVTNATTNASTHSSPDADIHTSHYPMNISTKRIAGNTTSGSNWSVFRFKPLEARPDDKKKETPCSATGAFARFAFTRPAV